MMRELKIGVLAGGWSSEREISLRSGEAVFRTLRGGGYNVTMYDPRDNLKVLMESSGEIDLAIIALHGKFGEDGCIQGLLDILGIPFVGSGLLSSSLAFHKDVAKKVIRSCGQKVPRHIIVKKDHEFSISQVTEKLGSMIVVKPVSEGSSIGISVCRAEEEISAGIEKAFQYNQEVMLEEYIDGREITCCVLGTTALECLPLIEIVPNDSCRFFDYDAKYTDGAAREICPAPLSRHVTDKAMACAINAHLALKCRVWSRTDMIIRDEEIFLLETNTIPGMTKNSLFPLAARAAGISFLELIERLMKLSLEPS